MSTANTSSAFALVLDEIARTLNARLYAAGIRTLQIKVEDGRLAATGTLTRQETASWTAFQQWFDQTYGGRIVLAARLDPAEGVRPVPALQLTNEG